MSYWNNIVAQMKGMPHFIFHLTFYFELNVQLVIANH